jgi:threonine aldolase
VNRANPSASNRLIDLYSDTQTRPSPGMRKAMAEAEVGDEQRGEDPTTNRLQDMVAELLGKEAAVFLPSGTLCNLIALAVHCRPGDEVMAAEVAHIFSSEAGGGAVVAGVQGWQIQSREGIFSGADVDAAVRTGDGRHNPISRLVAVEQTVNRGGGSIWPLAALEDVGKAAQRHGLALHMDGARILNAVVASGVSAKAMAAPCDTVWLDLSKGLGCPIGGVLAGPKDFILEAWRWKHRLGAAMRQSGIVAAAGVYALENNVERLAEDHANARYLAELVADIPGVTLFNPKVETNIVFFDPAGAGLTGQAMLAPLVAKGVRMGSTYGSMVRAVTHHDVSRVDMESAARAVREVVAEHGKARQHTR